MEDEQERISGDLNFRFNGRRTPRDNRIYVFLSLENLVTSSSVFTQ